MKRLLFILGILLLPFAIAQLEIIGQNNGSGVINLGPNPISGDCPGCNSSFNASALAENPWTNDSGEIFPKQGYPNTVTLTLDDTQTGFKVVGNVTDGFISQGSILDMSAIANAFAFSSQDGFAPTQHNKNWWSFVAGPSLAGTANISTFWGYYSAPFQRDFFGTYSGTVGDLAAYVAEIPLWQSGNVTNVSMVKIKQPTKTGGVWTNLYGIYIENQSQGVNNYAIYTNKGPVRFGDNVAAPNLCYSNGTNCQASGGSFTTDQINNNLNKTANVTFSSVNVSGVGFPNDGEGALLIGKGAYVNPGSGQRIGVKGGGALFDAGDDDIQVFIMKGFLNKFAIGAHFFQIFNISDATPTNNLYGCTGDPNVGGCTEGHRYWGLDNGGNSAFKFFNNLLLNHNTGNQAATPLHIQGMNAQSGSNRNGGGLWLHAANNSTGNGGASIIFTAIGYGQGTGTTQRLPTVVINVSTNNTFISTNFTVNDTLYFSTSNRFSIGPKNDSNNAICTHNATRGSIMCFGQEWVSIQNLSGSGDAFVCVNATGGLYRAATCGLGP